MRGVPTGSGHKSDRRARRPLSKADTQLGPFVATLARLRRHALIVPGVDFTQHARDLAKSREPLAHFSSI